MTEEVKPTAEWTDEDIAALKEDEIASLIAGIVDDINRGMSVRISGFDAAILLKAMAEDRAAIEQDRRRLEAAEKLADASESLLREYGYREPIADAAYVLQKALNEWEAAK